MSDQSIGLSMLCHAPLRQWTRRCCYLAGLALLTATLNLVLNGYMDAGSEEQLVVKNPVAKRKTAGRSDEASIALSLRMISSANVSAGTPSIVTDTAPSTTASLHTSIKSVDFARRDPLALCVNAQHEPAKWIHLKGHHTLDKAVVRFKFKTSQTMALLVYEEDTRRARGDFLVVALAKSAVVLSFDPGGGRYVLQTRGEGFDDERWHSVHAKLDRGKAELTVDNTRRQISLKHATAVNSNSGLYFLGAPHKVRVPLEQGTSQTSLLPPFSGCVKELFVNGKKIILTKNIHQLQGQQLAEKAIPFSYSPSTLSSVAPQVPLSELHHRVVPTKPAVAMAISTPQRYSISIIPIKGPTFKELSSQVHIKSTASHSSMDPAPILTAFSQNHFQEAIDLIGSIQLHMPRKKIVVYDLGLNLHARNQVSCYTDQ